MNDMKSVAGLDQVACPPFWQRERGLLKLRDHSSLPDPAIGTAVLSAARIVGIFLCQVGEIAASFHLLQHILRFGAGSIDSFRINFPIRSRQRSLYQNMADVPLLRDEVLIPVLVVIALQLVGRYLGLVRH